jgi:hypothetical protein
MMIAPIDGAGRKFPQLMPAFRQSIPVGRISFRQNLNLQHH